MFLRMTDGQRVDGDDVKPAAGHLLTERARTRPSGGARPGTGTPGKLPRRSDWRAAAGLAPVVAGAAPRRGGAGPGGPRPELRQPPLRSTAWLAGPVGEGSRPDPDASDRVAFPPRSAALADDPPTVTPSAAGRVEDGGVERPAAEAFAGAGDSERPPDADDGGGPVDGPGGAGLVTEELAPVPMAPLRPRGIPLTPLFGRSREQVTDHDDPFAVLVGMTTADAVAPVRADAGADVARRRWPTAAPGRTRVAAFVLAAAVLPVLGVLAVVRARTDQSVATGPRPSAAADPSDGSAFAPDARPTTTASPPATPETDPAAAPTSPAPAGPGASASPASTAVPGRAAASGAAPGAPEATADAGAPPSSAAGRNGRYNPVAGPSGDAAPTTTAPASVAFDPTPAEAKVLACVRASAADGGGSSAAGGNVYRLDLATWKATVAALGLQLEGPPERADRRDQDLVALRVLRDRGGVWDSRCD
jgi:hypothetical protein